MFTSAVLWAIALLLVAILLLMLEFFVPSGGLLGLCAVAAFIACLAISFTNGWRTGLVFLGIMLFAIPTAMSAAIRMWPYTPIGRRMLNLPDHPPAWAEVSDRVRGMVELVGKIGVAHTDLLPSGIVEIGGQRYDATAIGGAVDRGMPIQVVSVDGGRVRVSMSDELPPPLKSSDPQDGIPVAEVPPARTNSTKTSDGSSPLEDLEFDTLEDP